MKLIGSSGAANVAADPTVNATAAIDVKNFIGLSFPC
ncbi:hypothetical protein GP2143_05625 [marine gamma proteobacterium HTCC2143]|uniref:Uncharacterized protein n=1 Tax=marine gamma proteobacterium HTCC2143 TaxID=247633 RepID=A0YBH5_9GAMM|nr:hypothetical protein GP2143_05625 [marine gamma proteobacterium HTCC2143]